MRGGVFECKDEADLVGRKCPRGRWAQSSLSSRASRKDNGSRITWAERPGNRVIFVFISIFISLSSIEKKQAAAAVSDPAGQGGQE